MNEYDMKANWQTVRNDVKNRWPGLDQNDLDQIGGVRNMLIEKVRQRHGVTPELANQEVDAWIAGYNLAYPGREPGRANQPGYDQQGNPIGGRAGQPGYDPQRSGNPADNSGRDPGRNNQGRDQSRANQPGYDAQGNPTGGGRSGQPGYDGRGNHDPARAGQPGYDAQGNPLPKSPPAPGRIEPNPQPPPRRPS